MTWSQAVSGYHKRMAFFGEWVQRLFGGRKTDMPHPNPVVPVRPGTPYANRMLEDEERRKENARRRHAQLDEQRRAEREAGRA